MNNPFEPINARLNNLEVLTLEVLQLLRSPHTAPNADPYGDFKWLAATCSGVPTSTLRIKSAAGEIPGVIKFGKRVLYEKASVLNWLHSQTRQPAPDTVELERAADEQISRQLIKRGGKAV